MKVQNHLTFLDEVLGKNSIFAMYQNYPLALTLKRLGYFGSWKNGGGGGGGLKGPPSDLGCGSQKFAKW